MNISTWNIDVAHTSINFAVRHMVISKVRGRFAKLRGALRIDEEDITRSSVEVAIDAASLDTGIADRDTHLRSADFFDVEQFPELRFRSKRVESTGEGRYRVVGDLTIHGATREIALDAEYGGRAVDPWGHERLGFVGKVAIDRRDFGLKWNQVVEAGGVLVGERVEIEIDLEAVRAVAQIAA